MRSDSGKYIRGPGSKKIRKPGRPLRHLRAIDEDEKEEDKEAIRLLKAEFTKGSNSVGFA